MVGVVEHDQTSQHCACSERAPRRYIARPAAGQRYACQAGREQAFTDFHSSGGNFLDRDLYIFVFDRNGMITAFGSRPDLVGEPAGAIPGLEPVSFLALAWDAADQGGGWIQYDVISPGTKVVTPKESYILPLGHNEFIGCGAYRREGSGAVRAGKPVSAAWKQGHTRAAQPG